VFAEVVRGLFRFGFEILGVDRVWSRFSVGDTSKAATFERAGARKVAVMKPEFELPYDTETQVWLIARDERDSTGGVA
jgi:RimJ/RimL family protein N-acetyltransferase